MPRGMGSSVGLSRRLVNIFDILKQTLTSFCFFCCLVFANNWIGFISVQFFLVVLPRFWNFYQFFLNFEAIMMSISPIFFEQPFCTKVICAASMCLQFWFVLFWRKDFGTKAAHKMLVKLTLGLFISIIVYLLTIA